MDVLHVGNGANLPYMYVKRLRERGINSNLLFIEQHITNHPLWVEVDTDMAEIEKEGNSSDPQQEWVNKHRDVLPEWVHVITPEFGSNPYKQPKIHWEAIKKINRLDCDIIHAWNIFSAIWASFSNRPYIYHITGHYDWKWEWRADNLLSKNALRILVKRAISNAALVLGSPSALEKFEPRYENTNTYPVDPLYAKDLFYPTNNKKSKKSGIELFAGAAHRWDIKKNYLIFDAIYLSDIDDIHLTTVEWGKDLDKSKRLVSELGLEEQVSFVPLMSKPRLARTIQNADAVLDQFDIGIGSLGRQTLASGTPLISQVDSMDWEETPPVLRASNASEIIHQINNVREQGDQIGNRSAAWIQDNINVDRIIDDYIQIYENINKK